MADPHNAGTADETPEARFGAELRRLRARRGLSVRGLADELHRAHSSIVGYENGRRLPGVEVVEQYEDYFGLGRGTLVAQRERARVERLESPKDATVDGHLGDSACPYMGLRAFEYEDAALFFGREAHVEAVLARLSEARFVAVVGASGSGKSSFVRAGLLAALSAKENGGAGARVALLTPGEHPIDELATAIGAAIGDTTAGLADELRADPSALERRTRESDDGGLVIAVDQFEELFTLCGQEAERRCFVDALVGAWRDPASPVVVILALRADFYGRVAAYPELAAAVVAQQALIGPMNQADLRRAIELPSAERGLLLQPGLAQTMLEDLADEPGALPLLSHALLETWKRRRRLMLTVGGYHEAGGVRGAIAQTAERTLQELSEADRVIARRIFLTLTDVAESSEPTRRRADRAELAVHPDTDQALDRVLAILVDARLVTIDRQTVVLAHEALIRHWPRLRGWIETDRAALLIHRRLSDAARQWDCEDRERAALYRGARLAAASEWATERPDHLSQRERDFLTASHATAQRSTRRLAVTLVVVSALAVIAVIQGSQTSNQRDTAQATLGAINALDQLATDPAQSLVLGLRAYAKKPTPLVEGALRVAASAATPQRILRGDRVPVYGVAFAGDGRHLATAGADGSVRVWDWRAPRTPPTALPTHPATVSQVAFAGDGRHLATTSDDGKARVWDWRAPRTPPTILRVTDKGSVVGVTFADDDRHLATASVDGNLRVWDWRAPRTPPTILRVDRGDEDYEVAFAGDGRHLATASIDGTVRVWDWRAPRTPPTTLRGTQGIGLGLAFADDGRHVATAGDDGNVRVWDWRTPPTILRGTKGSLIDVAFADDGRHLAVASGGADGTIRVWDWRSPRTPPTTLRATQGGLTDVAFADGRHVAGAGADGTVRVWDWHAARTQLTILRTNPALVLREVAFAGDGRHLATAGNDGNVRVWDWRAPRTPPTILRTNQKRVSEVAFAPGGRHLATAGADETVRVRDWRAPRTPPLILRPNQGSVTHGNVETVAFADDGHLASAGADGNIRVWDWRARGTPPTILRTNQETDKQGFVFGVAFADDGRHLADGGDGAGGIDDDADGMVRVWDWRAPRTPPTILRTNQGSVNGVAFAPGGRYLASGGHDGTVRVWNWRAPNTPPTILSANQGAIYEVAFAPDGRHLATASADGNVHVWDWRAPNTPPTILRTNQGSVNGVAFAPDGRHLATAGADGTVRVWACQRCGDIEDVLRVARARVPRELGLR